MTSRTLWLGCLAALIAHPAVGQDAGILIGVADRVDPGIDARSAHRARARETARY